jgi:hypothetical protein
MKRPITDAILAELKRRKMTDYQLANLIGKPYTTVHRQLKTGRFSVESASRMLAELGLVVKRS